MSRPTFQLYKVTRIKYRLYCGDTYLHGDENNFHTESEAEEYYEAFVSSWDGVLDIKYDSVYVPRESIAKLKE